MAEVIRSSAVELAERIRAGRLRSADAVEGYLARIAAVDPQVGAYARVLSDRARSEARARDAEVREGRLRGPLHGVPIAIKDLMTIEGVPMGAGSSFLGTEPSRTTATAAQKLEAAGAVILGTTTLHEFALGVTSVNPHGTTPRNPWNLDRITGGSSGGSAAAVAAGLAAGALGSDTGGSIRIPSALCGIVGLKPTFGRISRAGVLPLAASFDTVGPMVRTVEDAALFLEALAGWDEGDPDSARVPAGRYVDGMARQMTGMRVGRLSGDFFDSDLDPEVQRALDDVTRALEEEASVTPVVLKTIEPGMRAQLTLILAEAAAFHRATFPGREAGYGPDVRRLLDQGAATSEAELEAARSAMGALQYEVQAVMNEYPILFGPAMPAGAPRIADADPGSDRWPEIRRMLARFSRLYNATGLPAIVLPAGVDTDGLPVAVQLGAGPFQEGLLLSVAHRVEQAIGWTLPELPRAAVSRRRSLS